MNQINSDIYYLYIELPDAFHLGPLYDQYVIYEEYEDLMATKEGIYL